MLCFLSHLDDAAVLGVGFLCAVEVALHSSRGRRVVEPDGVPGLHCNALARGDVQHDLLVVDPHVQGLLGEQLESVRRGGSQGVNSSQAGWRGVGRMSPNEHKPFS